MTHIALLRGINVGGQKKISMAGLVKIFEAEGYRNVRTYIQSGNIVFEAAEVSTGALAAKLEKMLLKKCGFEVKVIVRTAEELRRIDASNPLAHKPGIDRDKLHVTFLEREPEADLVSGLALPKAKNEIYSVKGREVYLYCPNGYGTSQLNNTAFERKLKVGATTRNWNTVRALMELTEGGE